MNDESLSRTRAQATIGMDSLPTKVQSENTTHLVETGVRRVVRVATQADGVVPNGGRSSARLDGAGRVPTQSWQDVCVCSVCVAVVLI